MCQTGMNIHYTLLLATLYECECAGCPPQRRGGGAFAYFYYVWGCAHRKIKLSHPRAGARAGQHPPSLAVSSRLVFWCAPCVHSRPPRSHTRGTAEPSETRSTKRRSWFARILSFRRTLLFMQQEMISQLLLTLLRGSKRQIIEQTKHKLKI
jgi:hypothetical protein